MVNSTNVSNSRKTAETHTSLLKPQNTNELTIEMAAGKLRVLHAGPQDSSQLPLVLLHGGGSDNAAISWYRLIEPLSFNRNVWAIDLPGFGGSIGATPVGGPSELADIVAEVLTKLSVKKAVVFGVSMGGDVALNLALRHGQLVGGLVLIASGGLTANMGNRILQYGAWALAQSPDWILLPAIRFANRFTGVALRGMVNNPALLPAQVMDEFIREARHPSSGIAYARYNQATLGRYGMCNDLSNKVHSIKVPALFFHGKDDRLVSPEDSRRAASRMIDARLIIVTDCGHWAQLECHDRFLAETQAFLAAL